MKENPADIILEREGRTVGELWLGGEGAISPKFLKKHKITAIVNCTKDIDAPRVRGIEYMRIPVEDNLKKEEIQRMKQYLPYACAFIFKNRNLEGKNVLVHCYAGMQRSAVCVLYYLMEVHKFKKTKAKQFIIEKRPIAFAGGKYFNFTRSIPSIREKKQPKTRKR